MKFFFFAGEPSGDLHGSHLIENLKNLHPHLQFSGVGGPRMEAQGLKSLLPMKEFEVMGFTSILLHLPKLVRHFRKVRNSILSSQPDAVILIDYPGFNIRLAQSLRKYGYKKKIIQYISPTVWAWGKNRIQKMANSLDLLFVIFPFEVEYFDGSLPVKYVGHPLVESIQNYPYKRDWKQQCHIPEDREILALFPGSRPNEITKHLRKQLTAAKMILSKFPNRVIALSCLCEEYKGLIEKEAQNISLKINENLFIISPEYTYDLMKDSKSAIAKSGTITLELALHQTPSVVMYEASVVNRFLVRCVAQVKIPHFCIVNILAKKTVFPEFIEKRSTAKDLYETVRQLEENSSLCLQGCQEVASSLGNRNASKEAALGVMELLA